VTGSDTAPQVTAEQVVATTWDVLDDQYHREPHAGHGVQGARACRECRRIANLMTTMRALDSAEILRLQTVLSLMQGQGGCPGTPAGHAAADLAAARATVKLLGQELAEARGDYEMVRDAVIMYLNPPDDDGAEPALMVNAVRHAASVLAAQPCTCPPGQPYEGETCDRCQVLGRHQDKMEER
jgi:hypothetical protein